MAERGYWDWTGAKTVDLPVAAGTPHEIPIASSRVVGVALRVTVQAKVVRAADATAASAAFTAGDYFSIPAAALTYTEIPTVGGLGDDSLWVEQQTGGPTTSGLSYVPIIGGER